MPIRRSRGAGRPLPSVGVIDVRRLRTDLDGVKENLARRGIDLGQVDQAAALDSRLRELESERDDARRQINELSKQVGGLRRDGKVDEAEALQRESRALGDREQELAAEASGVDEQLRDLLLRIPNLSATRLPTARPRPTTRSSRVVGYDAGAYGEHQRVPHWEIGAQLGILDIERAVKIAASMFTMQRGLGATLVRALCQLGLDRNADAFEEIRPPTLVTTATLTATGQLPKFADDAYAIERDDLWCIPTAEVPLTSIGRDEILDEADLPMRLMAYTPCFRREAGSAGRDTRGLLRVHEFDKVEVLAYATPEQAPALLDELLARAEATIAALGLAYRVRRHLHRRPRPEPPPHLRHRGVRAGRATSGSRSARCRGSATTRPAGPTSATGPTGRKGTELVHTLNGSALAVPRVWAAIVETHRQPDGSVALPEVLWPYLRGHKEIPAP